MTNEPSLMRLIRNTPVRDIIAALEQDGFILLRSTRTGGLVYRHVDGRQTLLHYHHGGDTLTRKTLGDILDATRWTYDDLYRLKLIT